MAPTHYPIYIHLSPSCLFTPLRSNSSSTRYVSSFSKYFLCSFISRFRSINLYNSSFPYSGYVFQLLCHLPYQFFSENYAIFISFLLITFSLYIFIFLCLCSQVLYFICNTFTLFLVFTVHTNTPKTNHNSFKDSHVCKPAHSLTISLPLFKSSLKSPKRYISQLNGSPLLAWTLAQRYSHPDNETFPFVPVSQHSGLSQHLLNFDLMISIFEVFIINFFLSRSLTHFCDWIL